MCKEGANQSASDPVDSVATTKDPWKDRFRDDGRELSIEVPGPSSTGMVKLTSTTMTAGMMKDMRDAINQLEKSMR